MIYLQYFLEFVYNFALLTCLFVGIYNLLEWLKQFFWVIGMTHHLVIGISLTAVGGLLVYLEFIYTGAG